MNTWKSLGNGVDIIIAPKNTDPISPTTTSRLLELEIYYRFDGTIPDGLLLNYSFDGAFVGSGTITTPEVPTGKKVVLLATLLSNTVAIDPATGLNYSIRMSTTVAGFLNETFTQRFEIQPASDSQLLPLKNVNISRSMAVYRVNWENQLLLGPNNTTTSYQSINVEEQEKSSNSPEGPYIQSSVLNGNSTNYSIVFGTNVGTRKFRITPLAFYSKNRAKSTYVTVNKIPSTPVDVVAREIRNGFRLSWSVVEEGVRYFTIRVRTAQGIQSFNISTANRYYDFKSLDLGAEYAFSISHRDDVTGLFSEVSEWTPNIKQLAMMANGSRVTDFRYGNYQPTRIYLGDKLIWVR